MSILSNPQLTTCIHSVCFKCVADKKSYCWKCQQPVTVITDNSVLTTVMRIVSNDEPQAISPEESIDEYSKKQFGELAIQVDQAIKDIRDKLKLLEETKIKLKARSVLEPARAKESMEKQLEESRQRTVCDMKKEAKKHQLKWHDYMKANEKELSRLRDRVIVAEKLAQNKSFILQHPGLVSHITKSSIFSYSPSIPEPVTSLKTKLDLRFGMLIGLSFMDSYKRLMEVIPEDVIQKVFCQKFRLGINDFAPFVAHLKHIDDILPSAPVAPQKLFGFSDFNPEECVEMIKTLLSLNEKVRSREDEIVTHIIARDNSISLEMLKVIVSGGWILKSTFVSNAKILKSLPDEYDYEWTRLKLGDKSINPRLCREAIGRRGKPFVELTIVVCSSNPLDSQILKAGGAETVQVLLVDVQSAIEKLFLAGKKKSSILIVYNDSDKNGFKNLVSVASSAGVSLFSLNKVIKLTMKGWFDRFNPVFEQRHFFHPQDRVRK